MLCIVVGFVHTDTHTHVLRGPQWSRPKMVSGVYIYIHTCVICNIFLKGAVIRRLALVAQRWTTRQSVTRGDLRGQSKTNYLYNTIMDPGTIPVPAGELDYDEDAEELFTGPSFADDSLEEYDDLEISEEQSGAQSGEATLQITYNPGLVSQYTH